MFLHHSMTISIKGKAEKRRGRLVIDLLAIYWHYFIMSFKHWPIIVLLAGSLSFFSCNHVNGWATGFKLVDGWGYILHTSDSGQTWARQGSAAQLDGIVISDVSAINPQTALVCGYRFDPLANDVLSPVIIKTIDGGMTWQFQNLPSSFEGRALYEIKAVDQNVVWACGSQGLILRTVNGGITWDDRSYPSQEAFFGGIAAADRNRAVAGGLLVQSNLVLVVRTEDGGFTWAAPTSKPDDWDAVIEVAWIPNSSTVWAVGNAPPQRGGLGGPALVSKDNGATWEHKLERLALSHTNAVFPWNEDIVWVGADRGNVRYTLNGGTTWESPFIPKNLWIGGISAISTTELWMAGFTEGGREGYIIHSIDGGANWEVQPAPSSVSLWRISMAKWYNSPN